MYIYICVRMLIWKAGKKLAKATKVQKSWKIFIDYWMIFPDWKEFPAMFESTE